ncbi:ATP-binding protein [Kerstersia similis]
MSQMLRMALLLGGACGLALLAMLVWSTANASRFAEYYDLLLLLNGVLALAMFVWVLGLSLRMWRQFRRRAFGARLTARFALSFAVIGVVPGVAIYMLSVQFMSRSIESWFNVRVNAALEAGLNLGRAALDSQLAELEARGRAMLLELNRTSDADMALALTRLRNSHNVSDAMVFTSNGRSIAYSTEGYGALLPELPPPSVMNQLRIARSYAAAESDETSGAVGRERLYLRVVLPLSSDATIDRLRGWSTGDPRWLQLIQPVPEQIAYNASRVQEGFRDYQELSLSRLGLRKLYGITLTMALLLTVFASVAVALALSRRLVRPLLTLAAGTKAVSVGDYRPLPEPPGNDEVGQLTRSFNAMTRQLGEARSMVERNRRQLERSNVYLESVLSNLSSGVLVFDELFRVTMFNQGAQAILHADLRQTVGRPLETVDGLIGFATVIRHAFSSHEAVDSEAPYWTQRFELALPDDGVSGTAQQPATLMARGTHLRVAERDNGYLVVFDDITELMSASRTVAWGEVARRLAHEIKNPLTPIQLSAERLAMKLADKLEENDARMLRRATQTIVDQVASLKQMVDEFREYARAPQAVMRPVDFNRLVTDVLALYGWDPVEHGTSGAAHWLEVHLDPEAPIIMGDAAQLRQVIHNLLSNARDAIVEQEEQGKVRVRTVRALTARADGTEQPALRFSVSDTGKGFAAHVQQRVFEPYVTTKSHGTGLGLAIVRKIVDEHGGQIDLGNRKEGGARVTILLTRLAPASTSAKLDGAGPEQG